jgi:small nuclear ribonucleoprotein (snRNP)-like protein
MNVVLDDAVEINVKASTRKQIGIINFLALQLHLTDGIMVTSGHVGRILLKGDCITLIQRADPSSGESL